MPESPLSPTAASETPVSSLLSHTDCGAGERAVNGDSCSGVSVANWHQNSHQKQVFLAMMAPQQMHHLLFPNQLQALIQQKQQALMLQQQHLKECYKKQQQIQMQLGQQLSNTENEELSAQQLMFQQLLQLQQQQFLRVHRPVLSSPALSSDGLSPAKMQQLWKELTKGIAEDKTMSKGNQDSSTNDAMSTQVRGRQPGDQQTSSEKAECAVKADSAARNVLYSHGVCNWPGCELVCDNINQFIKHIVSDHTLDDRSTAQCRVQMQVVQQLELQLCKERERLRAMTAHLRLPSSEAQSLQSDAGPDPSGPQLSSVVATNSQSSLGPSDSASPQPRACVRSPSQGCPKDSPPQTSCARAIRRSHNPLVFSPSSENEYQLYKNTDIRPPFTYATLIRQ